MVVGWLVNFGFWLWLSVVVDCGGCRGGLWVVVVVVVCYGRSWCAMGSGGGGLCSIYYCVKFFLMLFYCVLYIILIYEINE